MKRKATRREFLRGRAAADALTDRIDDGMPVEGSSDSLPRPQRTAYLIRLSREAMACRFEVLLRAGQYDQATDVALEALDLVEALEEQISVFRDSSQLSRLNRLAAGSAVEVEPRLFALLQLAVRLHDETNAAVDITTGRLSEVWGFSRRSGSIPTEEQLGQALAQVGGDQLDLDPEKRTVRFRKPGLKLNLGCIGKGYALDRCAEQMLESGVGDFMIHGGQSSVLARGQMPQDAGTAATPVGWTVGLRHPLRKGKRLAEIRLCDRALATSGSARQFFRCKGRRYSHILDPRTGRPAEGVLSATAIAPSAAMADALSTAFFVMGAQRTLEHCRAWPELAAILVLPKSRGGAVETGGVEIVSAGLEPDKLRILSVP